MQRLISREPRDAVVRLLHVPHGNAPRVGRRHHERRKPEQTDVSVALPAMLFKEGRNSARDGLKLFAAEVEDLGGVPFEGADVDVFERVDEEIGNVGRPERESALRNVPGSIVGDICS